jgi:acylglycerol lipase
LAADVRQRTGSLASADGTTLFWQAWCVDEPRGAVAVVHGLGEHSGRYASLAAGLNAGGVACWAVDLRGMGRSDGQRGYVRRWQEWVDDCAAFVRMVVEETGGVEVVPLGHSFGGVVVTTAVLDGAVTPRRFVLSNPAFLAAVRVPAWKLLVGQVASRVTPRLAMSNEVDPAVLSRDPDVGAAYARDTLVHDRITSRLFTEWRAASGRALARAAELRVPALVIVSEEDRLIDREGALEFAKRAGNLVTVRRYAGRYHEPFNDLGSDEVFDLIADWIRGR